MQRTWLAALGGLLLAAAGCSDSGEATIREEVWVVDFQTHATELASVLGPRGLEVSELAFGTVAVVQGFFAGLPMRIEPGGAPEDGASYICVLLAEDDALGRGVLDLGNTKANMACGREHGLLLGVFADNVLLQIEQQGFGATTELTARMLAVILAHEIGHGLGLDHADGSYGLGDIMNGNGILDVSQEFFFFNPEHLALLRRNIRVAS